MVDNLKILKYKERLIEEEIFTVHLEKIAIKIEPLQEEEKILEAFFRFMNDDNLNVIPIVNKDKVVVGQVQRIRFLEYVVLGRYGYGIHLNSRKVLKDVMEIPTTIVEASKFLEEASMLVQIRKKERIYDDLIVIKEDKYFGIVPVNILLEAITKRALLLARDSNPLTGLPGNWAIQREIERRLFLGYSFDVCYVDINNFKPFNDYYGFEKGDQVIFIIGDILKGLILERSPLNSEDPLLFLSKDNEIFVGHIGGDDFIVITPPWEGEEVCGKLIEKFEKFLPFLHGSEDFAKGYYLSKNRQGEEMAFPLLSLTCAIVNTTQAKITSFAHLASVASEVKGIAKKLAKEKGSSLIFRDRRNLPDLTGN